jgi:hypothetical protein
MACYNTKKMKTIAPMVKSTKSPKRRTTSTVTIGRRGFAKISAIEGIKLSSEAEEDFREFDRLGLSPAARRRALLRKYGRKS